MTDIGPGTRRQYLLIAHGSPDRRHHTAMRSVAGQVTARGLPCSVAFLEHNEPSVPKALVEITSRSVVTLGMLLAPGFHATIDVPHLLAQAPEDLCVRDLGPLGAGDWLFPILDWLVCDVDGSPDDPVILATAGSTRDAARLAIEAAASDWQRSRQGTVVVAAGTGPGVSLEDASQRLAPSSFSHGPTSRGAIVVPLMIAPGVLSDRAVKVADRHGLITTGTLAECPLLVDALVERLSG